MNGQAQHAASPGVLRLARRSPRGTLSAMDDLPAGSAAVAGRRIVVFGGGGFFGAAIVERLLADGVGPVAVVARHPVPAPAGVAVLRGDAENAAGARRILRRGDNVVAA